MYLTKTLTAENGAAVGHHRVMRVLLEMGAEHLQALVHSWPNSQSRIDGYPEIWRSHHLIPLASLSSTGDFRLQVLAALAAAAGPLQGASVSL